MDDPLDIGRPLDPHDHGGSMLNHVTPEMPCPYLPGLRSRSEAYHFDHIDGAMYEKLIARGFRRSGRVVYRPQCRGCHECRQLRVPVASFAPTKSMRRVVRRNVDVTMTAAAPVETDEKFDIFGRYLDAQHDGLMPRTRDTFVEFLYDSPVDTIEFTYRLGERIIGVSIADRCPDGLSSVYCFFDPDFAARSLGTLSVTREVSYCGDLGLAYYYLGFYIAKCPTMAYKLRFRPNEVLVADGVWSAVDGSV